MDHYNKGDGITDPWLDKDIQPLALTEPEIDDVVAFLATLTSPQYKNAGDQEYARQPPTISQRITRPGKSSTPHRFVFSSESLCRCSRSRKVDLLDLFGNLAPQILVSSSLPTC